MKKEISCEEIKHIQIDILNIVTEFCDKNNIQYFLIYGTLLGAVRHKGYIPWDDDIDIGMPREHYETFIKLFKCDGYELTCVEKDPTYPYVFAKVSTTCTELIESSAITYNLGVNIDIFPIDGLPEKGLPTLFFHQQLNLYKKILTIKIIKYDKRRGWKKSAILFLLKAAVSILPYRTVLLLLHKRIQKYPFSSADTVGVLADSVNIREYMPSNIYSGRNRCLFEGKEYWIPEGYAEWLTSVYGDYMKLPPKEEQITHHNYVAYWKERKERS